MLLPESQSGVWDSAFMCSDHMGILISLLTAKSFYEWSSLDSDD